MKSPLAPTSKDLFGDAPWSLTAGGVGPNGVTYSYNPYYFATPATAAKVAFMLGGSVVEMDAITPYGPFRQSEKNQMILLHDGAIVNAGIIAAWYDHGLGAQYVDTAVANEVGPINAPFLNLPHVEIPDPAPPPSGIGMIGVHLSGDWFQVLPGDLTPADAPFPGVSSDGISGLFTKVQTPFGGWFQKVG